MPSFAMSLTKITAFAPAGASPRCSVSTRTARSALSVRPDGHCEVKPEMRCVWLKAVERSRRLPWADEIHDLRPPVDNRLAGTSSWLNLATGRDKQTPKGWHVAA